LLLPPREEGYAAKFNVEKEFLLAFGVETCGGFSLIKV